MKIFYTMLLYNILSSQISQLLQFNKFIHVEYEIFNFLELQTVFSEQHIFSAVLAVL